MNLEKPEIADPFLTLLRSVRQEGILSVKQKEIINLGISVCTKCKYCVVLHTKSALEAGATREELLETCGLALMMGGTSVIGYVSLVFDCINKFSTQ
jgi:AhpD family alkylhydroperoxidase